MSELSINLNKLEVGSTCLDHTQMFPPHKKSAENSLTKIFQRHCIDFLKGGDSFQLTLDLNRPYLHLRETKIPLEKGDEMKKLNRIVRFYQNTGQLQKMGDFPKEKEAAFLQSKKAIRAVNDASIPGTNGQILAGMRIADDTLSLTRNILFALPTIGANDPIVNHLGYYAVIFWLFFAFRELDDGITEYRQSKLIGDAEGLRRAEVRVLSGGIVSTASLGYLGGKFCHTYASSISAAGMLGMANILFGVGSALAMGASVLGAVRCKRFAERLDEYLENTTLNEVDRLKSALKFLKDCITVTAEERAAITRQIEDQHPDWPQEEKDRLFTQRLADLTEVKVKHMKRRTSAKSLQLILKNSEEILTQLNDPKTSSEAIAKATILIHKIQKDCQIKKSLYILGGVAALVSFVAMLIITFLSLSAFPFVLYGIAAMIYLLISIYSIVGMLYLKKETDTKII